MSVLRISGRVSGGGGFVTDVTRGPRYPNWVMVGLRDCFSRQLGSAMFAGSLFFCPYEICFSHIQVQLRRFCCICPI